MSARRIAGAGNRGARNRRPPVEVDYGTGIVVTILAVIGIGSLGLGQHVAARFGRVAATLCYGIGLIFIAIAATVVLLNLLGPLLWGVVSLFAR
jgi:hypothetical protein